MCWDGAEIKGEILDFYRYDFFAGWRRLLECNRRGRFARGWLAGK
jgi:hypothetical protein